MRDGDLTYETTTSDLYGNICKHMGIYKETSNQLLTTWSGGDRWPYGFVHHHVNFDALSSMVKYCNHHADHSKWTCSFKAAVHHLCIPFFGLRKKLLQWRLCKVFSWSERSIKYVLEVTWESSERSIKYVPRNVIAPPQARKTLNKNKKNTFRGVEILKVYKNCAPAVTPDTWKRKNSVSSGGLLRPPSQLHMYCPFQPTSNDAEHMDIYGNIWKNIEI